MGQKLNFCHFRVCPFLCRTASEFPRMRSVCRMRCCPLSTSTLPSADSPQHTCGGAASRSLSSSETVSPTVLQPCPSLNYPGPWHSWILAMSLDSPQSAVQSSFQVLWISAGILPFLHSFLVGRSAMPTTWASFSFSLVLTRPGCRDFRSSSADQTNKTSSLFYFL